MPNPVVHFEVVGKTGGDYDALVAFYKSAFDWNITPASGAGIKYSLAAAEAPGIAGGIGGAMDGYEGHVTFYVQVPKLEDALKKIESLGGTTMMPPDQVPGGPRIALFKDPDGHVIGLVEQ